MYALTQKDLARFWSKVEKSEGCWNWSGFLNNHGYPCMGIGPANKRKRLLAHRAAFELVKGEIPAGALLDHICRNRACVNPDHLRPVNEKQNAENRKGPQRNNTSGYLGVSFKKSQGRWGAKVYHNRQQIHIGYFATAEEADSAATAKRLELFTHNEVDRLAA